MSLRDSESVVETFSTMSLLDPESVASESVAKTFSNMSLLDSEGVAETPNHINFEPVKLIDFHIHYKSTTFGVHKFNLSKNSEFFRFLFRHRIRP